MKELLVYLYENCAISDVSIITLFANDEKNFRIKTVGEGTAPITTIDGFILTPELDIASINSYENYIGLLLPGGEIIGLSDRLKKLIQNFEKSKKIIGAFCAGPKFLAFAGILTDHRYTTSLTPERNQNDNFPAPFPWENYIDGRYVVDDNVITAKGVAILEFADQVIGALGIYAKEGSQGYTRKRFHNDYCPIW